MLNLLECIIKTDHLVWKNISKEFPDLYKEINLIKDECQMLWGKRFSLFLAGSLSFCARTNSFQNISIENGKSDVDMWIIVQGEPKNIPLLAKYTNSYHKLGEYDLVTVSIKNKYTMSVKLMKKETFLLLTNMFTSSIVVHREKSILTKKTEDIFFSFSRKYYRLIKEEKVFDGYKWYWDGNPFIERDFLLSDLHSFILFGAFGFDGILLNDSKNSFVTMWINYLPQSISIQNMGSIFKYYQDKNPTALLKLMAESNNFL